MPRIDLITPRMGTLAEWTLVNPVLDLGEQGWEIDSKQSKRGDGVTSYLDLPYEMDGVDIPVTQSAHGFTVGNIVYYTGSVYAKAQADTAAHAEVVGIVVDITTNQFLLRTTGLVIGLTGLTAGTTYFLSPTTAGALTATEPTAVGQVSKPLLVATSTTAGVFANWRGMVLIAPPPAAAYVHDQAVASPVWTINHNLGFFPNITFMTSANEQVFGGFLTHVSPNQAVMDWSPASFGGKAYAS